MSEWISVKERMPDPMVTVLFVHGVGKLRRIDIGHCGKTNASNWFGERARGPVRGWSVTHWQPMPAIPKEEK